jgi:ankyrin repeat protein
MIYIYILLIDSCLIGNKLLVRLLLERNINIISINNCDEKGNYPLICASQNGHLEIVKLLLQYGADVNIVNKMVIQL